jgi:hypothetical protein
LEWFDEFEEWKLIQEHYCIVWAFQDKLQSNDQTQTTNATTSNNNNDNNNSPLSSKESGKNETVWANCGFQPVEPRVIVRQPPQ